jgi:hypothetical protein
MEMSPTQICIFFYGSFFFFFFMGTTTSFLHERFDLNIFSPYPECPSKFFSKGFSFYRAGSLAQRQTFETKHVARSPPLGGVVGIFLSLGV